MTSLTADTYRTLDLLALDHTPECPYCSELNAQGATVCADCGGHLTPSNATPRPGERLDALSPAEEKEVSMPIVHGCTCGGNDCCTACVLASYEPTVDPLPLRMMNVALDATVTALTAPRLADTSNVVDMHSKKVRP